MRSSALFLMGALVAIGAGCTETRTPTGLAAEDVFVRADSEVEVQGVVAAVAVGDVVAGPAAVVDEAGALLVTVSATNFSFSPSTITADVGQEVVVTFADVEGVHTFIIEELGIQESVREGHVVSFVAPLTPGVYPFYCGEGSHHVLGMEGTLLVK